MTTSEMRYGELLLAEAPLVSSWSAVALMMSSARGPDRPARRRWTRRGGPGRSPPGPAGRASPGRRIVGGLEYAGPGGLWACSAAAAAASLARWRKLTSRRLAPHRDGRAIAPGRAACRHAPCSPPTTCTPGSSPADASPEVIEVAWRALLRRHHPDVAGPDGPRAREADQCRPRLAERPGAPRPYDRERGRHGIGPRDATRSSARAAARRPAPSGPPGRPAEALARPVPGPCRGPDPTRSTGWRWPTRRRSRSGPRSTASYPRTGWPSSTSGGRRRHGSSRGRGPPRRPRRSRLRHGARPRARSSTSC